MLKIKRYKSKQSFDFIKGLRSDQKLIIILQCLENMSITLTATQLWVLNEFSAEARSHLISPPLTLRGSNSEPRKYTVDMILLVKLTCEIISDFRLKVRI